MNYTLLQEAHPSLNIKFNHALSDYSHTKTGGNADAIVFPTSKEEVAQVINWTNENSAPLTILGNLSNLIVRDGGIPGVVMILTDMDAISVEDNVIYSESGASIIEVSQMAEQASLTGLEFACGIPGSVGGAIFMNAGAYDGEVKDIIVTIDAISRDGELKTYSNDEAQFSYRHSVFQENDDIILGVRFELKPGIQSVIRDKMAHLTFLRQSKQPLEYPSCGSVFKRPVGHFTGKLIQDAGLQGHRVGGAEISRKHAGFIINVGGATATDYVDMIEFIQETIWDINQVQLETEVRIIGEEVKVK